jgi:hypothetical protein
MKQKDYFYMINKAQLLMFCSLLLAGCSGDGDGRDVPVSETDKTEIRLAADVWNVMEGTRATTIPGGTLASGSFTASAYVGNTTTSYINPRQVNWNTDTDKWVWSDGKHYWPASGNLDFFAFMPATAPTYITGPNYTTARQPQFTCTLPMTSEGQGSSLQEFIYALTTGQNKTNAAAGVNLTFKRPFASINFQLAASHPAIRINSITFKGLKSGGTCSFDGNTSTWSSLTPDASTVNFVATINQDFSTNANVQAIGATYLMVPQNWTEQIEVNASWNDWGDTPVEHTITATLPAEKRAWAAGTSYTYTFNITLEDLVVNMTDFTEQW